MNLLIIYNSALDPDSMSGVQRYFIDVVREWKKSGHRVDFLVGRSAWPSFERNFPGSTLISSDNLFFFPPHRLHQTWRYLPAFAWRMVTPYFVRTPVRYDLVLACAQFIYEVKPAFTLARRHRAAMCIKIHHVLAAQTPKPGLFDRLHLWSERTTTRWLNRRADLILCTTRRVAADFNAIEVCLGLSPSSLISTGNALDFDEFPYHPDTPRRFDAVLLGRVHTQKGVMDAPAIWQEVRRHRPDARLLIIGEGPHRPALEAAFSKVGLGPETGAVVLTGGVSDQEKNQLVAQCRVGLSLSREEGWGLSITEFMAAGLPVVAMELPVFDEVFPNHLDLVPQGDVAATAVRLRFWLENPDAAQRQGGDNRQFILRYDARNLARAEINAIEAAVQAHRQRGKRLDRWKSKRP